MKVSQERDRWVKVWFRMWEDERILELGERLPCHGYNATMAVAGVLHLNHYLLSRDSEDGVFRYGNPLAFALACFPDFTGTTQEAAQVFTAFTSSGIVEPAGEDRKGALWKLRNFKLHNDRLLKDRDRKRRVRSASADTSVDTSADQSVDGSADLRQRDRETERQREEPPLRGGAGGAKPEQSFPAAEIAKLWREVKAEHRTAWIGHSKVPGGEVEKAARARWREVPDLELWRLAMVAAAGEDWWAGRKVDQQTGKPWRATLESFVRDKHFEKWIALARESDWRYQTDEDLAFESWREQIVNRAFERDEFDAGCPWPDADVHSPKDFERLLKEQRVWWKQNVWGKR